MGAARTISSSAIGKVVSPSSGGVGTRTTSTSSASTRPRTSSIVVDSRSVIATSGWWRCQRRRTGATIGTVRLCAHATRRRPPAASPVTRAARTEAAAASTARRASATAARPAAVSRTPFGSRWNSGVRVSRSSAASWCDTAGCDECSVRAAWVIDPVSATATRHSNARREGIHECYRLPSRHEGRRGKPSRRCPVAPGMTTSEKLTVGTIGAGRVAQQIAGLALRGGHRVVFSNSRGPESLAGLVAEFGPGASAGTVAEAARADVVVLAVGWDQVSAALEGEPTWRTHRRRHHQPVAPPRPRAGRDLGDSAASTSRP